ncbi:MAG: response regulator [Deltaproteobacteria bacterium]|nr:response regulator [Deltaproteobacteria bacterium]
MRNLNINKSIGRTLLIIVFSVYLIIALIITVFHLILEYNTTKDNIQNSLKHIYTIVDKSLAQALWEMNDEQLDFLVDGMMNFPDIIGVKITDNKGEIISATGIILTENGTPVNYDNESQIRRTRDFYFFYEDSLVFKLFSKDHFVGILSIYSDNNVIFARLKTGVYLLILDTLLKIIALGFIIRIVLYFILTKPLAYFTGFINNLDFDDLEDVRLDIQSPGKNELKILENAFNNMIQNLRNAITRQQKAESSLRQSEKKYRDMFENAIEGLYQTTADGKFIDINQSMANILGFGSPSEFLEYNRKNNLYYLNKKAWDMIAVELFGNGFITGFETEYYHLNGNKFWASISARIVYDSEGELLYCEGSMIDITEKKEKQEADRAREAAEIASHTKSVFLANMSHEIRTPMNAIIGLTELCLFTDLNTQQVDYLVKVVASAKSLLGIINDILDISKIEEGKMDIEETPFNLEEVLQNISNTISFKAAEKGLEFVINIDSGVPMFLIGDPLRLTQVLLNLGNNAIKFTQKGEILINVDSLDQNNEDSCVEIKFSVIDSGIGMTDKQQDSIFDSFQQADSSTSRKYGGTGLGLAISRNLVKLMGGNIWLESEQNVGSGFFFTLKLGIDIKNKDISYVIPRELHCLDVLIISDNKAICKALVQFGSSLNFVLNEADSINKAVELLQKNNYRMVILNETFLKEDMNNYDLILEKSFNPDLRILTLVSPVMDEQFCARVMEAGIPGLLTKPVTGSSLYNAVIESFKTSIQSYSSIILNEKEHKKLSSIIPENIRGASILVFEDNSINQQIIREILEREKFNVTIVSNGSEGLERIKEKKFNLIFMDIQMPGMDGYEVTRKIRKDYSGNELPIIAMTAHAMETDRKKSLSAGMNGFVSKPIIVTHLYNVLSEFIKPADYNVDGEIPATNDISPLPDYLPGLNIRQALSQLNNMEKILVNTFKLVRRNYRDFCIRILEDLDNGNWDVINQKVHTLYGLAATIGANQLSEICKEIEIITKGKGNNTIFLDKDSSLIKDCRNRLDEVLQSLDSIEDLLDARLESDNKSIQPDIPLLSYIEDFLIQLGNSNYSTVEMISVLKQYNELEIYKNEVNYIEELITQFDFKEAIEQLLIIRSKLD